MLKTSFISFSISSKLLSNIINKIKVHDENDNKNQAIILFIFFITLKKPIGADYFTFNTKKVFNFFSKVFI